MSGNRPNAVPRFANPARWVVVVWLVAAGGCTLAVSITWLYSQE